MNTKHIYTRLAAAILAIGSLGLFAGCGSDNSTQALVSGTVVQGPVAGAKVFADHLTGLNAKNHKMDPDEAAYSATTDANGNFTLAKTPDYDYVLVSEGGIDTVTNQPAMQMLAPAGSRNVTPLTTLVALDTTGKIITLLTSIGVPFDTDLSKSVTPLALVLSKSVESTVITLTTVINPNNNAMTFDQMNNIQMTFMQRFANQLRTMTKDQVSSVVVLTQVLQSSVADALVDLTTSNGSSMKGVLGLTLTPQDCAAYMVPAKLVTTLTQVIGTGTTGAAPETALINPAGQAAISTEINATIADAQAHGGVIILTQVINTPPTIDGIPSTSAAAGVRYSFVPTVFDRDGNSLTFSIENKPNWADFNVATGELSGIPKADDAGKTTQNIVISVSDGMVKVSLPAFNLTVL